MGRYLLFVMGNSITSAYPPVSVVIPILNEADHLQAAVDTILSQEYLGEIEVILAIGPSRDGTEKVAEHIARKDNRVTIVSNPSGRTPNALNIAFAAATHDIVVRIDGHSEIAPTYIASAVETMQRTGAVNVGGIMAAEGITPFQKAVARAMRSVIGVGASRFHTGGNEGAADTVYLGTFQKSAVRAVGGYDEEFTRAQDWEMNYRLRQAGGLVYFDPRLVVIYRPRKRISALAKQYFEYGRWRRAVSRRYPETVNFRYLAPPIAVVISFVSVLGSFFIPAFGAPFVMYLLSLLVGSLIIGKSWGERFRLPLILITMHMSWGIGFLSSPRKLAQGNLST